jgi:hypothetical protein
VPFSGGRPNGKAEDVVTGFLNANSEARGRPVGVAVDKTGALLIADDVGNTVWRVTSADQHTTSAEQSAAARCVSKASSRSGRNRRASSDGPCHPF